jgi:hypothetical protein
VQTYLFHLAVVPQFYVVIGRTMLQFDQHDQRVLVEIGPKELLSKSHELDLCKFINRKECCSMDVQVNLSDSAFLLPHTTTNLVASEQSDAFSYRIKRILLTVGHCRAAKLQLIFLLLPSVDT